MTTAVPTLTDLFASDLPDWTAEGPALTDALDLEDDPVGAIPATFTVVPLGDGLAAPVAYVAALPVAVAEGARERAAALLATYSRETVDVGVVELGPTGHVRYRRAHAPLHPWAAGDAGDLASEGLGAAQSWLPAAYRMLETAGVPFAPSPGDAPTYVPGW